MLGEADVSSCRAGDAGGDGGIEIAEVIAAVGHTLSGCEAPFPTPTPDPLAAETGRCYESAACFPCDVYPCAPFAANRAFCCILAMGSGTFSWCPEESFDAASGSCGECAFPCK